MNFDSHEDALVLATAELVNVVTPGERQGRPYEPPAGRELQSAIGAALRLARRGATAPLDGLDALTQLGQQARPVFEQAGAGKPTAAAHAANALIDAYQPTPRLAHHDGEPWHLHFHGRPDADPTGWGGGVAVGLARVLGSEHAHRLGVCEASACDRVFVDVSRNGARRFCSTACQNRTKAAAHRARQR